MSRAEAIRLRFYNAKETGETFDDIVKWISEEFKMEPASSRAEAKYYENQEPKSIKKANSTPKTPSAPKKVSKAEQIRVRIRAAKETGETFDDIVKWVTENFETTLALAKCDVRYYWKEAPVSMKRSSPAVKNDTKVTTGPLNNLSDAVAFLEKNGVEVQSFDGIQIKCSLGTISMAFGDFFVNRPITNPENPPMTVMGPAHFRRFVTGDDSKIGKLDVL